MRLDHPTTETSETGRSRPNMASRVTAGTPKGKASPLLNGFDGYQGKDIPSAHPLPDGEERSAIMEHDAGTPRAWADAFAQIVEGLVPTTSNLIGGSKLSTVPCAPPTNGQSVHTLLDGQSMSYSAWTRSHPLGASTDAGSPSF